VLRGIGVAVQLKLMRLVAVGGTFLTQTQALMQAEARDVHRRDQGDAAANWTLFLNRGMRCRRRWSMSSAMPPECSVLRLSPGPQRHATPKGSNQRRKLCECWSAKSFRRAMSRHCRPVGRLVAARRRNQSLADPTSP